MNFSGGKTFYKILIAVSLCVALAGGAFARPKILVDVKSGRVLEHEDAFQRWYPASLTKIMTAYLAFSAMKAKRLRPSSTVLMSKHATGQPASKMYFNPGDTLTLDSALKMMLIKSANDVSVAVAETVAGSEAAFVDLMNSEARRIGMTSTRFINPNGLPGGGQYTTARDLALLAVTVRREFPEYAHYFALEGFSTGKKKYTNYNLLIGRFRGADGMKTGYICSAGFNQVSSATRGGRTLVAVVLGEESLSDRADASADLLEKGFKKLISTGPSIEDLKPYGAGRDRVVDLRDEICNKQARKERAQKRDKNGKLITESPYIKAFAHTPNFVFAGLTARAGATANDGGPNIHRVPIPIPRPLN